MNRRIRHIIVFSMMLLITSVVMSQESDPSLGFWYLKSLSGELSLLGTYRKQYSQFNEILEEQNSTYVIGGLKLNTSSYLWNPGIISINLNGEFNPETRDEKYLTIPDRSEVRTLKKLDLRTTLLSDKKINLTSYLNLNQSYFNRENLTNVRSNNKQWGGLLSFNNKILPLTISYRDLSWDQLETESERTFNMNQKSLEGRASKSFYVNDKHELRYSHDEYNYQYTDLNNISNVISRIVLNNNFFFDKNRNYGYNSIISYYDQVGSYSFNKLEANERLVFHLPYDFDFYSNYYYYRMDEINQLFSINRFRGSVKHQLFQSLTTQIFVDNSSTNHSLYKESNFKTGVDIKYTKKLSFGRLNLGYSYFRHHNSMDSEPTNIDIVREEHSLNDIEVTILNKPYVDLATIVITDLTSTIVYQEGLDYFLIEVNDFIEVLRIPGGQIVQDQPVLINYTAIQPGSYHFEANNHKFYSSVSLFNRLIELYYNGSVQDFADVRETEFLTLNRYSQNIVGGRVYYKFATAGVEYDYYSSSIIPYKRVKYYLNLNLKIKSVFLISLNSNLRDYMLLDNNVNHRYANVSARIAYNIKPQTRLNFEAGFLTQTGRNIDLDLLTARVEIVTSMRQLHIKAGFNYYKRMYLISDFQFAGSYIQVTRKF